jgi:hypothetical protein
VAVTVADRTTYNDADVDTVYNQLWPRPALEPDRLYREMARAVLDALVAAGWAPRAAVAEEIAQAIEAYDGPLTEDGPRTTLARVARAHGEADHG